MFLLLLIIGIVILAYRGLFVFIKSLNSDIVKLDWNTILVALLGGVSFIFLYMLHQNTIYYWDMTLYWEKTIRMMKSIEENDFSIFYKTYTSILDEEYNELPSLILAPFMYFFGNSIHAYVASTFLVFIMPSCIVMSMLLNYFVNKLEEKVYVPFIYLAVFSPTFYIATMGGCLDSLGLPVIFTLLIYLFATDFQVYSLKKSLTVACLLVLLTLTRRWYIFWMVAYILGTPLYYILQNGIDYKRSIPFVKSYLTMLSIILAVYMIAFKDFFMRSFFNNYASKYASYQLDLSENVRMFLDHFGYFTLALALVGIYWGYSIQKRWRSAVIFLSVITLIIYFTFIRVNMFSLQHYFVLLPQILVLALLGLNYIASKINYIPRVALFILFFFNFGAHFSPFLDTNPPRLGSVFGGNRWIFPKKRNDIVEIHSMVKDINEYTKSGKKLYVLASSFSFNDDLLKKALFPNVANAVPFMGNISCVDRRDNFPLDFFYSDYILVGNPVQTHMDPSGQKVMVYFAEKFLSKTSFSKHFTPVKTYNLDFGIQAILYKKESPISISECEEVAEYFKINFPEWPNMHFQPKLRDFAFVKGEEGSGMALFEQDSLIYIHPGDTTSTSLYLDFSKKIKNLSFSMEAQYPDRIKTSPTIGIDGEIQLNIYVDGLQVLSKQVVWNKPESINLEMTDKSVVRIEFLRGVHIGSYDGFYIKNIRTTM